MSVTTAISNCFCERELRGSFKEGLATLIQRVEHRFRLLDNKVLRRIFGFKRAQVAVIWMKRLKI
jgi:hypothetical protein